MMYPVSHVKTQYVQSKMQSLETNRLYNNILQRQYAKYKNSKYVSYIKYTYYVMNITQQQYVHGLNISRQL